MIIDLGRELIAEGLRIEKTTQITVTGCVPKSELSASKRKRESEVTLSTFFDDVAHALVEPENGMQAKKTKEINIKTL